MVVDARHGRGEERVALPFHHGALRSGDVPQLLDKLGEKARKATIRGRQRLIIPFPVKGVECLAALSFKGSERVAHALLRRGKGLLPGLKLGLLLRDMLGVGRLGHI